MPPPFFRTFISMSLQETSVSYPLVPGHMVPNQKPHPDTVRGHPSANKDQTARPDGSDQSSVSLSLGAQMKDLCVFPGDNKLQSGYPFSHLPPKYTHPNYSRQQINHKSSLMLPSVNTFPVPFASASGSFFKKVNIIAGAFHC